MQLINQDCLEYMKTLSDNSVDLIFTDPPYALGSEIIIKADGKPDYQQARDFMNKWDMPTGEFWEEWYKEAYRVLKHGGHCLMFGMDRQLLLFKYYGHTAGFTEKQSLYWYFISNFPKASDLSKNIDKRFGLEREVVGINEVVAKRNPNPKKQAGQDRNYGIDNRAGNDFKITTPAHPLAQKYNGLKYSIAPLKQTNETIMVFQKPYKHKSCLNDVLAYEEGDSDVTVGAVNIEGCRVGTEKVQGGGGGELGKKTYGVMHRDNSSIIKNTGRFPAQTYIDSGASEVIDKQSGVQKSHSFGKGITQNKPSKTINIGGGQTNTEYLDSGGASRILHKCDYEKGDYDIYHYSPKVSKKERNEGLEGFEEKRASGYGYDKGLGNAGEGMFKDRNPLKTNPHPTVKPVKLLSNILKLFKTPNKQVILDPFMGSGSMGISAIQQGYDYIGIELSEEYYQIAEARINNQKQTLL